MSKPYKQCKMYRLGWFHRAWIDSDIAKVGNVVKFKVHGEWIYGWVVTEVGETSLDLKAVEIIREQFKQTRKTSDI